MSWLLGGSEMDDVNVLPASLVPIYQQPHRVLGLDKDSCTVAILRETFRKVCLNYIQVFTGLGEPKLTLRQVLLAYHLCRGTLKGPAARVKESLDGPYFDFHPEDILPVLRPVRTKAFPVPKEYRGCRMLNISCIDYKTTFSYTSLPKTTFIFDVHYCMRRHTIERDFEGFNELFEELAAEMVSLPSFPHSNLFQTIGLESRDATGGLLADFLTRAHHSYAAMKKFSPRLFRFLAIDFEKVQGEEEGAILSILDTPTCPYQTVWHVIDEKWLVKWRKFAMGRGARRYVPPGPLANAELLAESRKEGKKELKIPDHYRCVNYNVWRFYELVHGGGPCIGRKEQDIYSDYGMSLLQAVIRIQTWVRIFLASCLKKRLFYKHFSCRQVCKSVILDITNRKNSKKIAHLINREQNTRMQQKLKNAALFSQVNWRKKKNYVAAENLERLKYDQEVFAKSKGPMGADDAPSGGLVVRELLPIVHIGSAFYYERTIHEEEGRIAFQTRRLPATEVAVVYKSTNPNVFTDGSKIVSINGNPTISMEYDAIKKRLASAAWPLVLGLEMPVKADQKPTVHSLLGLPELGDLRYNTFKLLLTNGMQLIKHTPGFGKMPHLSTVKITDNEFFYTSRLDPQKRESDLYNKFSMYAIKFVRGGADSEQVRSLKKVNPQFCIEVVNEDRGIIFELPTDEKLASMMDEEDKYVAKRGGLKDEVTELKVLLAAANLKKRVVENGKREKQVAVEHLSWAVVEGSEKAKYPGLRDGEKLDEVLYHSLLVAEFASCMKKLVIEVRGSQQFMDTDGFVTKRSTARTALRKIDVS